MTSRLTISVPATLTVLGGTASLSSLETGPGITLSGAGADDTIALTIVAGNAAASLNVAGSGGVSVASHLNTLTLTGTQAQIDLALAGLLVTEPATAGGDVLHLSATDTAAVAAASAFAVDVVPATGPAFVAPPRIVTLQPNALNPLSGLLLADPIASGLAAMGLGDEETLSLTLSVAQGVLLLPGLTALNGISATGLGTGTIMLSCTAGEINELNTLLAGLEFAGPASGELLDYALWNATGVLPRVVTYGNIYLDHTGTAAANGVFGAGTQTLTTGGTAFGGTISVAATASVLGNVAGGAIEIAPGAVLEVPDGSLALSGSSADFGSLAAPELGLSGTLLVFGTASFAGGVMMQPGATLDFSDGLTVYGTANNPYDAGLGLDPGAVLQGNGTLMVGNFSQGAAIEGGTLQVLSGDTLQIDTGWITSDALLQVGGGGVMVLGPVSPLYGIFNTMAVTIDPAVELDFMPPGAQAVTGGYASTLGGAGGVFVISDPQFFSGTVENFGAGDALIFPGLQDVSIYNAGANSFHITGIDTHGNTDTYTIYTSIAAGLTPAVGRDAEGDEEVYMSLGTAMVIQGAPLAAAPGVAQPLTGVSVQLASGTAQGLTLTLSTVNGSLSSGGTTGTSVTLTAANIAALNSEIEAVDYFGNGTDAAVLFSSSTGPLAGIQGSIVITPGSSGTVSGYSGLGVSAAEMVSFGVAAGLPQIGQAMAAGGVLVDGTVEFENILDARGLSGTGLLVDGGGEAIFDSASTVSLGSDVTLGDASGTGTVMLVTDAFSVTGNVTLAPVAGGAGSALDILGNLSASGAVDVGIGTNAASLLLEGGLAAGPVSLGSAGTMQVQGTAHAGGIANAGSMLLTGAAVVNAGSYEGGGTLELGGTSTLAVAGAASLSGVLNIGTMAVLTAANVTLSGAAEDAGVIAAATLLAADALVLAGGTLEAGSIAFSGTVAGRGAVEARGITVTGLLEAQAGRLLLAGNITNSGTLEIGLGAILEVGGTLGLAPVTFAGGNAELVLDDAAAASFSVTQMGTTDAVDLVGIAPSLVSVSGAAGEIFNSQGSVAVNFGVIQSGGGTITVVSDGAGGALLTVNGVLPCFARGTGILSPNGYRRVEDLRPGDPVITANGERRPVRWIGWRTLDLGPVAARAAQPVLIMPDAFGPGRPHKMLRLSPSHCIYVEGVLIPVAQLVNGATVRHEWAAQAATYFHIELDRHDIVLAEGLMCESYFDDGNRAAMYRELGRRCPARRMYAPVVTAGARLAAVRRALHEQALRAGFQAGYQLSLRGMAAGQSAMAEFMPKGEGHVARLTFPRPVRELVLLSPTACPADTNPDSGDRRELGICLGAMRGVELRAGWQARAAGDAGSWMGARAELGFTRARREISLPLAAVARSWGFEKVGPPG